MWMREATLSSNLPKCGFEGFLVLDEMKIKEDLIIKKYKGSIELVGFVKLPEPLKHFEAHKRNTMHSQCKGQSQWKLYANARNSFKRKRRAPYFMCLCSKSN